METQTETHKETTEENCTPCEFAKEHKWWGNTLGNGRSHCRKCHRTWRSRLEAHCVKCHEHFANHSVSDLHYKNGECVNLEEATNRKGEKRFSFRESAFGRVWFKAYHGERPQHWVH